MADHPRKAIRAAVKAALVGKTRAQDRVYTTREVAWKRVELPGVAIYALEESAAPDFGDTDPRILRRDVTLAVLGIVMLTEAVDDELDALAQELEAAMHADPTFGGKARDSILTATAIEVAEEQGRPIGAIRLTYTVTYDADARSST